MSDATTASNAGRVWLPAAEFWMGSDERYPEERPLRRAVCNGFWLDQMAVTVRQFAAFVAATGYVSFAEQRDPKGVANGSAVFVQPAGPVSMKVPTWWALQHDASWHHPRGLGNAAAQDNHPVTHIAYADALAYCAWAGTRLPTEIEWECAARDGHGEPVEFAWGAQLFPDGARMANIWQGEFPWHSTRAAAPNTEPVDAYSAHQSGCYNLIGNVWEWTQSFDDASGTALRVERESSCCAGSNEPVASRVIKGGSFLCAENYCARFRPAARLMQPMDSPACHIGFRCASS